MNENDMKTEQSKVRLPAEGSLILSSSPHLRTGDSTHKVMLLVILALIPAVLASVWFFGWNALRVVVYCMAFCALFEYLWCVLAKTGSTLSNLSALVTGLILALNVSPLTPWWLCLAGAFIAIIVAKQVFGGLGQNPFNPAAVARVAMLVGATGPMTMWMNPAPGAILGLADKVDAVASATPLAAAKAVAGNAACSIQVNAVKAFHDVNMVRDGIIRHNGIAKALYFHIAAVVRADGHTGVDHLRDGVHDVADLVLQLGFLGFQLFQAVSLCGHLLLDLLGFGGLAGVLFSLAHQHANLLGKLVAVGAQGVTLANGGAVLGIQIDDLVYQRQLGILKLLFNVLLDLIGVLTHKTNIQHDSKSFPLFVILQMPEI